MGPGLAAQSPLGAGDPPRRPPCDGPRMTATVLVGSSGSKWSEIGASGSSGSPGASITKAGCSRRSSSACWSPRAMPVRMPPDADERIHRLKRSGSRAAGSPTSPRASSPSAASSPPCSAACSASPSSPTPTSATTSWSVLPSVGPGPASSTGGGGGTSRSARSSSATSPWAVSGPDRIRPVVTASRAFPGPEGMPSGGTGPGGVVTAPRYRLPPVGPPVAGAWRRGGSPGLGAAAGRRGTAPRRVAVAGRSVRGSRARRARGHRRPNPSSRDSCGECRAAPPSRWRSSRRTGGRTRVS